MVTAATTKGSKKWSVKNRVRVALSTIVIQQFFYLNKRLLIQG